MTTENEPIVFAYNCTGGKIDLTRVSPKCALCKSFLPKHKGEPIKTPELHTRRRWLSKEEVIIIVCHEGACDKNKKGSLGVRAEGVFDHTLPAQEN